ncbi:MAG: hypothetical protein K1X58_16560, partial [Flavobacteriales bacterium]|nr:hypothetical protein [Flavobacteriales bacterium]
MVFRRRREDSPREFAGITPAIPARCGPLQCVDFRRGNTTATTTGTPAAPIRIGLVVRERRKWPAVPGTTTLATTATTATSATTS